jgi:hypothetical protein
MRAPTRVKLPIIDLGFNVFDPSPALEPAAVKERQKTIVVLLADRTMAMPDQFPVFETHLRKRGRTWKWYLCTTDGDIIMQGSDSRRRSTRLGEAEMSRHILRRSRLTS